MANSEIVAGFVDTEPEEGSIPHFIGNAASDGRWMLERHAEVLAVAANIHYHIAHALDCRILRVEVFFAPTATATCWYLVPKLQWAEGGEGNSDWSVAGGDDGGSCGYRIEFNDYDEFTIYTGYNGVYTVPSASHVQTPGVVSVASGYYIVIAYPLMGPGVSPPAAVTPTHVEIPATMDLMTDGGQWTFIGGRWVHRVYRESFEVAADSQYVLHHYLGATLCEVRVWWRAAEADTDEYEVPLFWVEGGNGNADFSTDDGTSCGCGVVCYDANTVYIRTGDVGVFAWPTQALAPEPNVETTGFYRVRIRPLMATIPVLPS